MTTRLLNPGMILAAAGFSGSWIATGQSYVLYLSSDALLHAAWTACMFIAFFATSFISIIDRILRTNLLIITNSLVGILGQLLLFASTQTNGWLSLTLSLSGIAVLCCTFGVCVRIWGGQISQYSVNGIVLVVSGSLVITGLFSLFHSILPAEWAPFVNSLLVIASSACLIAWPQFSVVDNPQNEPGRYLPVRWSLMLKWGVAACLFAIGMVWSMPVDGFNDYVVQNICNASVGVLIIIWVFIEKRKLNLAVLLLPALGLIQLFVFLAIAGVNSLFLRTMAWSGESLLWVWVLGVSCWQGSLEPIAPGRMVSRGMILLFVSQLAGNLIGNLVNTDTGGFIALIAAILIVAAELILLGSRFYDQSLNDATSPSQDPNPNEALEAAINDFDLTPRESEVFAMLRRGHTVRHIASEMYLSPSTVNSHIHAIYTKMGIHSRQEVINYSPQVKN